MKSKALILAQPELNPTDFSIDEIEGLSERELDAELSRLAAPYRKRFSGYFTGLVFRAKLRKICELGEAEYFQEYLRDLGLSADDLKGKKVMDLGARDRVFAHYCLRQGVNADVVSVDPIFGPQFRLKMAVNLLLKSPSLGELSATLWSADEKKTINQHTVGARYQSLPFRSGSVDLVLAHNIPWGSGNMNALFQETARILGPSGETRISPYCPGQMSSEWVAGIEGAIGKLTATGEFRVDYEAFEEDHPYTIDAAGQHFDRSKSIPVYRLIIRRSKDETD